MSFTRLPVVTLGILLATPVIADVMPLRMPSGNINCSVGLEVDYADIICEIRDRSGPAARPRPTSCSGPWGHKFTLRDRGEVLMECGGPGPSFDGSGVMVFDYDRTERFGEIRCTSTRQGLTCQNADGHGFSLSRASQTVK